MSNEIEKEAELIEAARERPFLYDLKTAGYKDPIMKMNAWSSIAAELNWTDGNYHFYLIILIALHFRKTLIFIRKSL